MLDFVALDFETANKYKNSACSLAVITVENGQITKKHIVLLNHRLCPLILSVLRFMVLNLMR